MTTEQKSWNDLEDWDNESKSVGAPVVFNKLDPEALIPGAATAKAPAYVCNKCHGTGVFRFGYHNPRTGKCHACNGKGGFVSSPEARAKSKAQYAAKADKKAAQAKAGVEAFKISHPEVYAAITNPYQSNEFTRSLHECLVKYGSLSEKQVAAVERGLAKRAERQVERAAAAPLVAGAGINELTNAFVNARNNGLKFPKVRIGSLTFSLAGANSANAGALYVKDRGEYVGKITTDGRWFKTGACSAETDALVQAVCKDPKGQAVAHGLQTGNCSCCGRELTDPVSVANGIGPICAEKFGW